jgi:S-DNA-T family DNA segregation ATPase FtsK/SpoIIIE
VHKVIDYLKEQVPDNEYATDVIQRIERSYESDTDDDTDELLQEAIETVVRAEQASVSMLQRRFRIGYNRAARLIDMMEARGIVGPSEGSRPRKVLMTEEEFLNLGKDPDDKNEN